MTIKKIFLLFIVLLGLGAARVMASCPQGGSAVLTPTSGIAGTLQTATMTWTAGVGLSTGDQIGLRIPDGWSWPHAPFGQSFVTPGYSTFTTAGIISANLSMFTSGQFIFVSVDTGTINPGATVYISYSFQNCPTSAGSPTFRMFEYRAACNSFSEIANQNYNLISGIGSFVHFGLYDIFAVINQLTAIPIRVTDNCGNVAAATSPITYSLGLLHGDYSPDNATAAISTAPLTVPFSSGINGVIQSTGTVVFYRLSAAGETSKHIQINYLPPGQSSQYSDVANITNLTSGLSSPSIDTGLYNPNQTTASFSPDQDGTNDFIYINFNLPMDANWQVKVSTDPLFNVLTRQFFGYGHSNRVSWDGYTDWSPNAQPEIAAPATYYFEVNVNGLAPDRSLSATLTSAGLTGLITVGTSPVAGANVNVWGPTGRNVRTKPDGSFSAYGLQPGVYNYNISKDGLVTLNGSFALGANQTVSISSAMTQGAVVRISVVRPSEPVLNELWGSVNANTSDWKYSAYGSIHFAQNSLTSDAGDNWNAVRTTYTTLSLIPGQTYNLKFQVQNLGIANDVVTAVGGQVIDLAYTATKRGNISGLVCLPSGGANAANSWVNIEVGLDANKDGQFDSFDPSTRFYGNAQPFQNGLLCSTYTVFGVSDGTYTIVGRAPNFAPLTSTGSVVSGGQDFNVNLGTFSTGSTISGTITVEGDTTNNPSAFNGFINVPISAWNPTTYTNAYQTVAVPVNSSVASATYSLSGLTPGTYNVWTTLPGFELNPPGQQFVTIIGAGATLNLDFKKFGGSLNGTITSPNNDFSNVTVELLPYDTYNLQRTSMTPITNSYAFSGLGTGYYTLRARYNPTGLIFERNVQIVNGTPTQIDINLTAPTFGITGTVVTLARSPYNSLSYLVNSTTATSLSNVSNFTLKSFPANRIVARRLLVRDDLNNPNGGGAAAAGNVSYSFDPMVMFYGYYDSSGSYSISNLTPGLYLLSNNGELDGDISDGKEIAETARVINVVSSTVTGQDFILTDGFDVSGNLTIDSGLGESGRNVKVELKSSKGDILTFQNLYMNGTSAAFTLNRIPPGTYVLTAEDQGFPKKYSAKDVTITIVSASLSNQDIKLLSAAKIQGQLKIKATGELLTNQNYTQYLPSGFRIEARSNPWFQGGWGNVQGDIVGTDGLFSMTVSPGTYDIVLYNQTQLTADQIAQGKKTFVTVTVSGIRVTAGQTTDVGVIDLREGVPVSGIVTDSAGTPLPNIRVIGDSGSHDSETQPEAFTDKLGAYTLQGLDSETIRFYDIVAAPRPDSGDQRFSNVPIQYAESRRARFDTKQSPLPKVNFKLDLAQGSVSGTIAIPNGASQALTMPFDQGSGINLPGADIILNKHGDVPQKNPLGNIEQTTNPDGTFTIKGLAAGVYDMWALALNYGSAIKRNITVGNADVNVGTLTVVAGYKMSGTLAKADGTLLNSREFDTIVGVRDGFEEIIVGQSNDDASGNIIGYTMSGFQAGKTYSILLFGKNNDVIVLASSVTLSGDTVQNFVVGSVTPVILTQAAKNIDGTLQIQFELTQPLRNTDTDTDNDGVADDSQFNRIIQLKSGTGTLSHDSSSWMTSDRKRLVVTYTPGAGETSFVLTASCTFVTINAATGNNDTKTQDFTYFVGIGKQRTVRIANAGTGTAELDEDVSQFQTQSGTFGDDSNLIVDINFRSADSAATLASQAPLGTRVMAQAEKLGLKAYPTGMAAAMQHLKAMDIDPFSSFYDLVLPAGVSHFFPEGKDAKLCLKYDSSVADPYALNVYYFNEATNEYLLENTNKAVDPDNERICVNIAHASVFTVLASSQSILNGAGYTGDLNVVNFPNPFNLKQKSVNLQDPGSLAANQSITGTMIKMSIPTSMSGAVQIQIFNAAGEKVRTLSSTATGGAHYYLEWDGKNDHGSDVASGVYIGRFTIGGSNEKFFKMAVVK